MIECIPNFSEGQRPKVVAAIAETIRAVPGVYVLDTHIDADHHRSVITFAGENKAVAEAAFHAVRVAAELIDMTQHQGQHPRIGATDVLPFVPLRSASLAECVELAHAVGQRIGDELGIPVYLYGAAATRPERQELPAIRRGNYEGLRDSIQHDSDRTPDYGSKQLGSAGATAVGARKPLIAYNLFLNTTDVSIAKRIARAVRGSSGGLRGVRALGMLVNNQAQVSMNLTDYRHTPVHRAVDMVAREAAYYGVAVASGELVGLIPEDALIDAGRVGLRLPMLNDAQILERRLAQAIEQTSVRKNNELWLHLLDAFSLAVHELAQSLDDITLNKLVGELAELIAHEQRDQIQRRGETQRLVMHVLNTVETLNAKPDDKTFPLQAQIVIHLARAMNAANDI